MLKETLLGGVATTVLVVATGVTTPAIADGNYNWDGFYLGAHAGLGAANFDGGRELPAGDGSDPPELADNLHVSGIAGGFHAGFNRQIDSWVNEHSIVLGIEADVTFTDWGDIINQFDGSDHEGISADVDLLASIRARLGVARDNGLLYVTGGAALTDATFSFFEEDDRGSVDFTDVGGVVGGGGEVAAENGLRIRIEGLYYFFNESHSLEGPGDAAEAGDFGEFADAFVVRVGVSGQLGKLLGGE